MAKKDDIFGDDFDSEFDFLDGDDPFSAPKPKTKMGVVKQVLSDAGKETISSLVGDRDAVISTIKDIIFGAVPSEISTEIEGFKDVINSAEEEIKKASVGLKKSGRVFTKSLEGILPNGTLKDKARTIKEMLTDNDSGISTQAPSNINGSDLSKMLTGNLSIQGAGDALTQGDVIKENIASKRHAESINKQITISSELQRINTFNTEVTVGYYKQSLKLASEQLFVNVKSLEANLANNARVAAQLEAIIKNTSYPDAVKILTPDTIEIINKAKPKDKDKLLGEYNPINRIKENLGKTINRTKNEFIAGLTSSASMLDQAGSFKGMADMMSPGTLLGMGIAEAIKGAASRQLEARFSNSKFGKDRIYNIKSLFADPERVFKDMAENSDSKTILGGAKKKIFNFMSNMSRGKDTNTMTIKETNMDLPISWNNRSQAALVNVIPGLLSSIYGEVKAIRTKTNTPNDYELHYDYTQSTFKTTKQYTTDIKNEMNKAIDKSIGYDVTYIVSDLEEKSGIQFSPDQRLAVKRGLLEYVITTKNVVPKYLLDPKSDLTSYMPASLKEPLTHAIRKMVTMCKDDAYYYGSVLSAFKSIRENTPNLSKHLREIYAAGHTGILNKLGLLSKDDLDDGDIYKFDSKKILRMGIDSLRKEDTVKYTEEKKETSYAKELGEKAKSKVTEAAEGIFSAASDRASDFLKDNGVTDRASFFDALKKKGSSFKDKFVSFFKKDNLNKHYSDIKSKVEDKLKGVTVDSIIEDAKNKANHIKNMSVDDWKQEAESAYNKALSESERLAKKHGLDKDYADLKKKGRALGRFGKSKLSKINAAIDEEIEGTELEKYKKMIDERMKTAPAEAEEFLRTKFFMSKEYASGAIKDFEEYAASYGVHVDMSKEGIKTKLDNAKSEVTKVVEKTESKLYDYAKEKINNRFRYRTVEGEELEALRLKYFESPEHQSGAATDFEEWLNTQKLTAKPKIKTPPLKTLFNKTRAFERMMFKKTWEWGTKALASKYGGKGLLVGAGRAIGSGITGYGKLLGYGLDGIYSAFTGGKSFMGVDDNSVLGKTRAVDKKVASETVSAAGKGTVAAGAVGASAVKNAGSWYSKLLGAAAGGIGSLFGIGNDEHTVPEPPASDKSNTEKLEEDITKKYSKPKNNKKLSKSEQKKKDIKAASTRRKNYTSKNNKTNILETTDDSKSARRDGSWEDMYDRFKEKADVPVKIEDKKENPAKGILGILTGTLVPIFLKIYGGIKNLFKPLSFLKTLAGLIPGTGMIGKIGKTAVSAGAWVAKKASLAVGTVKGILNIVKAKLIDKVGAKGAARLLGKIATRFVPGAGMLLLAYDAAIATKLMASDGMDAKSAVSTAVLGVDVFNDNEPIKDINGEPIKPEPDIKGMSAAMKNNNPTVPKNTTDSTSTTTGSGYWDRFKSAISNTASAAWDNVKSAGAAIYNPIRQGVNTVVNKVDSVISDGIGWLASKYESGGNYGLVHKDNRGYAMGKYQFNTTTGRATHMEMIARFPELKEAFNRGGSLESKEYQDAWKALAKGNKSKEFAQAQEDLAVNGGNFRDAMQAAKKYGLDINKNKTLGAILFSTAMQYGGDGAAGILDGAFRGKNVSSMTEADQINAIMDTKLQQLPRRFTVEKNGQAKAEKIWKEQRVRINNERNEALAAIGKQTSSQPTANVTPNSTVNNNSIPIPIKINTSSKTDNAIDSGSKSSLPASQASYRPSTMSDTVSNITRTSDSIKTETKSPIDIDMSTTNNILARQLDIQQQTLGVITNIYEKMVSNSSTDAPLATQAKVPKDFPTSSININKRTYRS